MIFNNKTIKFKITSLVLLSALLPILLYYVFGVQKFLATMEEILARELTAKASLAATDIDRFIEQRIVDTKVLARAQVLSSGDMEKISHYLRDVAMVNPWINEIDLLNGEGDLLADSGNEEAEARFIWESYPQLKIFWQGDASESLVDIFVIETPYLDNGEGAGLLFLVNIHNPDHKQDANFLLVELAFKDLQSLLISFRKEIDSNRYVYLVKNDGTVMLTDDPNVQPFEMFPDLGRDPKLLSFFSEPGAKGHHHYTDSAGENNTIGYADLAEFGDNQGLDWSIIVVADQARVFEAIYASKNTLMILGVLLTFIMTCCAYLVSRRITRPLSYTIEAAKELEGGNYASQIPEVGSLETRLLAKSFNAMVRQIFQRNNTLEKEIVDRKLIEQDLLESNSMKSEFIATASHELRTPLSIVIGYVELLIENDGLSTEDKKEFLQHIYDKAFALDRIVDELLDVSRIETGRTLSIKVAKMKIAVIGQQVVSQFQKEKHACSIDASFEDEELELTADKGKLFQVFENLIGNAIKFSPNGGVISIKGETLDRNYRVSIADEGIGMTAEQQQQVFNKFYRADGSDTAVDGLGIGLYLSKSIIELHGGQVWLESTYGQGTTFFFTLPINQ